MHRVNLHRLYLLGLLGLSVNFAASTKASEYQDVGYPIVRQFSSDTHQSGSQVWWIEHDENNLIYFATSNGMSRWDGENWEQFKTPNKSIVRSLTRWTDGNYYAGTINDVGYFDTSKTGAAAWQSLSSNWEGDASKLGETWSVASNEQQVIYSTKYAILSWNGQTLQQVENLQANGYRVFNVNGELLLMGNIHNQVHRITDSLEPTAEALPWKAPLKLDVKSILYNRKGEVLLVSMNKGIYKLEDETFIEVVSPQQLPEGTRLYNAIQANDGYYYLASLYDGIFILDEEFNLVRQYEEKHGIGNSVVLAVHEDTQGSIWLAGEPNISAMAPPHLRSIHRHAPNKSGPEKLIATQGKIFSIGAGVHQYRQNKNPLYPPIFESDGTFDEKVWDIEIIGDELLVSAETGVFAFDYIDGQIGATSTRLMKGNNIQALSTLPNTSITYVAENSNLYRLSKEQGQWQSVEIEGLSNQFEYVQLEYDKATKAGDEIIWASGSDTTLYRLAEVDEHGQAGSIQVFDPKEHNLGNDNVAPFLINGQIQIGISDGIYTYSDGLTEPLQLRQDVPDVLKTKGKDVFLLQKDSTGRLTYHAGPNTGVAQLNTDNTWITTEAPFYPFKRTGVRSFLNYNNATWLKTNTGQIYRFSEAMLEKMPALAKLNLQSITNINDESLISKFKSDEILASIPYNKNSIRIAFALADHSTPFQTEYRARISGQGHQNWTRWSAEAHKDFPLLAGGDYLFEVQARDPWQRIQASKLEFTILPPWYLTRTAWVVYFLAALLLLFLSGWLTQRWRTRQLTELNVALEKTVLERTQEVSAKVYELEEQQKLKDRFFSNVSHEFRTPLTLIIGPLETMLSEYKEGMNSTTQSLTATALNNANKMLALVGQVLDLNRLEVGKLPLRISEYDIAELLRNIQKRFEGWAQQEDQTIHCVHCEDPILLYFDQDQIDKCVANLLSNAIKYSGKNTQITINLLNEQESVTLQIIDNGRGISDEAKPKVFERFFQDKASEQNATPGTGIGLSLVQELIELHHGHVNLASNLGEGCCFSLMLKKGQDHFSQEQLVEPLELAKTLSTSLDQVPILDDNNQQDQTTLLIVDDNAELRHFISLRLSANYRIIQAQDGEEGFKLACEALPDLIVSDVMMPNMTGYELTEKIKSTPATRTIPVILLTAKTSKREIVDGFMSGADDYLIKPFDTSELIMRVNAQISIRKTIRDNIKFEQNVADAKTSNKTPFVENIQQLVITHLSNPAFSVEELAKLLFMSRATLSRKCKDELQMTPKAYIIQTRMHHACDLLQAETLSISEIAYAVGFESLAYFSRSFKKHTGTPPSEYSNH